MVTISHRHALTLENVAQVALGAHVALDTRTRSLLTMKRRQVAKYVNENFIPTYGFNRGFGYQVDTVVSKERVVELQYSLIRSHACGVGDLLPKEIVRAAMLLRAQSLALLHSGVRAEVIVQIITYLNKDIIPAIPSFGSLGASGDLAPLSHMTMALIGEGMVLDAHGKPTPSATVLRRLKVKPLQLEMKEGLALINGVQVSTAIGVLAARQTRTLLDTALRATAISTQVLLGSERPFAADVHQLRPHPGAIAVAKELTKLMRGSPLGATHRRYTDDGEIQDPYSLRCTPQILGPAWELLERSEKTLRCEINSVTDNPLVFSRTPIEIVSAGHFHGMPVAVALYDLVQAVNIIAKLSHLRSERFVDPTRNRGLGTFLLWPKRTEDELSISCGMMIPEYVAGALMNQIWGSSMPSHLFSLSSNVGQEDHVSMSMNLALRLWETLPRVAEILAIELAYGAQAAAIRREQTYAPTKLPVSSQLLNTLQSFAAASSVKLPRGKRLKISARIERDVPRGKRSLSPATESVINKVRRFFPTVIEDRPLAADISRLAQAVMKREIV